jgi:hypothetical protein
LNRVSTGIMQHQRIPATKACLRLGYDSAIHEREGDLRLPVWPRIGPFAGSRPGATVDSDADLPPCSFASS